MNDHQMFEMRQSVTKKVKNLIDAEKKYEKQNAQVVITDHAVIRFLERVHNINIEALKKKILSEKDLAHVSAGCSAIKKNGRQYVFKEKSLVTIL